MCFVGVGGGEKGRVDCVHALGRENNISDY